MIQLTGTKLCQHFGGSLLKGGLPVLLVVDKQPHRVEFGRPGGQAPQRQEVTLIFDPPNDSIRPTPHLKRLGAVIRFSQLN